MIDLPGLAIKNFHEKTSRAKLYVHDTFGPKVEMPISLYFRNEKQLPKLEKKALKFVTIRVSNILIYIGLNLFFLVVCRDIFNDSG